MPDLQTIHSSSLHFFRLPEDKARLAKTRSNVAIVQLSARPPHYVLQVGFAQLDYRAEKKSWYVVVRNFFLLLLNFSAWPCLSAA